MSLVCFLDTATDNLHRAVEEMVLLSPWLRKHTDCSREPSFRELAIEASALAVHVDLLLDLLEHLDLSLLGGRIHAKLLHIRLESLLVRSYESDGVRALAVMHERTVDILGILDKILFDSLRRIFLAVSCDKKRLETSHDIKHLLITHVTHVSCMKPAVNDGVRGGLRVLPVSGHDVLALDADLALHTERLLDAIGIKNLDLHRLHDLSG